MIGSGFVQRLVGLTSRLFFDAKGLTMLSVTPGSTTELGR